MAFWDCSNITLTSSNGRGELYGNGRAWWSLPGIGYLLHQEYRPRLLTVASSRRVLIENLLFSDSPYWTTLFERVEELEVRRCGIVARRTGELSHGLVDLTAFNTDGFDLAGCRHVWIHDCAIWTQDDAIAVKDAFRCPSDADQAPNGTYALAVPSEHVRLLLQNPRVSEPLQVQTLT